MPHPDGPNMVPLEQMPHLLATLSRLAEAAQLNKAKGLRKESLCLLFVIFMPARF